MHNQLAKSTVLVVNDNIDLKIGPYHKSELMADGNRFKGNRFTLAVLDVFSTPKSFEQGLETLNANIKGAHAWIELTKHIQHLYQSGLLRNAENQVEKIHSNHARFEGAPVHIRMLNDRSRTESFQKAIRETVTEDDIVLDIGTGTGVMAITAAMAGARHVYAIERSSMAGLAQRVIDSNNLSDRITLLVGDSGQIVLPQKADVFIAELIGNDPLQEGILPVALDAIKRLLQPDARFIPERLCIFGLPLSIPEAILNNQIFNEKIGASWEKWYGIDFSPLVACTQLQDHHMNLESQKTKTWTTLSDPILLSELELKTLSEDVVAAQRSVSIKNDGLLNGVLVYSELQLSRSVHLSLHPERATSSNHWANHIWIPGKPITLRSGDSIDLQYSIKDSRSHFEMSRKDSG
jgi:hypothetical protein